LSSINVMRRVSVTGIFRHWRPFLALLALGIVSTPYCFLNAAFRSTGKLRGILTAKSSGWIEVKADGENRSRRFIPAWRGGLPREGGALDDFVLKKIKQVRTGNRVEVHWGSDEYFRVLNVRTLAPFYSSGSVRGLVVAKGENWIDVKEDKKPLERFIPQWLGRLPEDGGGLDQAILSTIAETDIGGEVIIKWAYDDRKRITGLKPPDPPITQAQGRDSFPLNYPYITPPQPGSSWFQNQGSPNRAAQGLPDPSDFAKPNPLPGSIIPDKMITRPASSSPVQGTTPLPDDPFGTGAPNPAVPKPLPDDPFGAGAPNPAVPKPLPDDPFGAGAPNPAVPKPLPDDPFGAGAPNPAVPKPLPNDPFGAGAPNPAVSKPIPDDPFGAGEQPPPANPFE
jgi:hypothetical protein